MKKIFYYLTIFILVACSTDNKEEVIDAEVTLKELTPVVVVKQGNQEVVGALENGKIILDANQEYKIEITFTESVELHKGNFLKVKAKNDKEYFADFYGRNVKEIEEKVTFKKAGYEDYTLEIIQRKVVPNFYVEVKNQNDEWSYITLHSDKKTIKVLNTEWIDVDVDISFFAPIFLENQQGIEVQRKLDGSKYNVKVNGLTAGGSIQLPIYTLVEGQKGDLIGEIVFVADDIPYYQEPATSWYPYFPDLVYYETDLGTSLDLNFVCFLNQTKQVFIDNINTEYVKEIQLDKDNPGAVKVLLHDKILTASRNKVHFFDVYEGEVVADEIHKKQNAEKREIILRILGW